LVAVELTPSKPSPQKINEVIEFTANAFGFYLPEYEFSLIPLLKWSLNPHFFILLGREEDRQVVQEKSEERAWEWFPEEAGIYSIGVTATDEKEKAEFDLLFLIHKEDAAVVLALSKDSPQQVGTEISFTATTTGMASPKYEFALQRIYPIAFFTHMTLFMPRRTRVVLGDSEENSWTWTPEREGLYAIHVSADDGTEKVKAYIFYRITKKKIEDAKEKNDRQ
jgi:hypothetical protein